MIAGITVADIARKYGRSQRTVELWRLRYDWPAATGTRGHWHLYDPGEVDRAVSAIVASGVPDDDADPDELLDARQAASEAGIAYGTLRGYMSRAPGRHWPLPDESRDGTKLWKRSTVRAHMAARRPSRRRRAPGR